MGADYTVCCIYAKVNSLGGPFGISELGYKPDIRCLTLATDCNSLVSAREINTAELLTLENVTIVIFTKHDVAQNLDNYSFNSFYAN